MANNKKTMTHNRNPISLQEGKAFIDGVEVMDGIKLEMKFTPNVAENKLLGDRTPSSRWLGGKYTGSMTRRRSTNFLEDKIKEYMSTGRTPELTIQGIMTDANSDYYQEMGEHTVTAIGCVMTGDLPLIALDTGGEFVEDVIAFNIKDVVF